jgi:hypothetical protein
MEEENHLFDVRLLIEYVRVLVSLVVKPAVMARVVTLTHQHVGTCWKQKLHNMIMYLS